MEPKDRPRNASELTKRITAYLESVETRLRESEIALAAEAARPRSRSRRRKSMKPPLRPSDARDVCRYDLFPLSCWQYSSEALGRLDGRISSSLKNKAIGAEQEAIKARVAESRERERAQNEEKASQD